MKAGYIDKEFAVERTWKDALEELKDLEELQRAMINVEEEHKENFNHEKAPCQGKNLV